MPNRLRRIARGSMALTAFILISVSLWNVAASSRYATEHVRDDYLSHLTGVAKESGEVIDHWRYLGRVKAGTGDQILYLFAARIDNLRGKPGRFGEQSDSDFFTAMGADQRDSRRDWASRIMYGRKSYVPTIEFRPSYYSGLPNLPLRMVGAHAQDLDRDSRNEVVLEMYLNGDRAHGWSRVVFFESERYEDWSYWTASDLFPQSLTATTRGVEVTDFHSGAVGTMNLMIFGGRDFLLRGDIDEDGKDEFAEATLAPRPPANTDARRSYEVNFFEWRRGGWRQRKGPPGTLFLQSAPDGESVEKAINSALRRKGLGEMFVVEPSGGPR